MTFGPFGEIDFRAALSAIPAGAGAWAVAVSGGADSVALLRLLIDCRPEIALHVVHLDHETRNGASADDATFVCDLASRLGVACTVAKRSDVEATLDHLEPNLSARFRAARLALFRQVVDQHGLPGVLVAHHADDQAETILHRLIRGSGFAGLAGMSPTNRVGGVLLCRPLLDVRRDTLRRVLREAGQAWRDDVSNDSPDYLRNRLRALLATEPALVGSLLKIGKSCRDLRSWTHTNTPEPADTIRTVEVIPLAEPLRREFARRWLARVGVPEDRIDPGVVARLITMAEDAASSPRQNFPGNVLVRRTRGTLGAVTA